MAQTVNGIRWTIEDLDVLPQSEGTRYEIIAGELFVTRAPHYRHQQVIGKVFRQLDIWSENIGCAIAISPNWKSIVAKMLNYNSWLLCILTMK